MLLVASAVAHPAKTDLTVKRQVSTGTLAPAVIDASNFRLPASPLGRSGEGDAQVVLSLNVDEHGNAHVLKVVKSANPELDNRVVTAVQQSHFQPAKLNNQSISSDVDLTVVVTHNATVEVK
jgi:TonB family protein